MDNLSQLEHFALVRASCQHPLADLSEFEYVNLVTESVNMSHICHQCFSKVH